jgi:hypothetical protein
MNHEWQLNSHFNMQLAISGRTIWKHHATDLLSGVKTAENVWQTIIKYLTCYSVELLVMSLGSDTSEPGKLLTRPPELSDNPTCKVIWERLGGMGEWVAILRISIWDTSKNLYHALKSYDMGLPALLPIRRKVCCGLFSPLKFHCLGWVWTRDPWVQWQAH